LKSGHLHDDKFPMVEDSSILPLLAKLEKMRAANALYPGIDSAADRTLLTEAWPFRKAYL
jgi:hypothetical protein